MRTATITNTTFETTGIEDLRKAVRRLMPSERHSGGLAMKGKSEIIAGLQAAGFTFEQVKTVLDTPAAIPAATAPVYTASATTAATFQALNVRRNTFKMP